MTTQQEDRELADVQLSLTDPEVRLPAEKSVQKKDDEFSVSLKGEKFRLADEVGAFALMQFAASSDIDANDPRGMASVYWLLEDLIHADDWHAFQARARKSKANGDDLVEVVSAALEAFSGRPTKQPAGSSDGASAGSGRSTETSSTARARASKR